MRAGRRWGFRARARRFIRAPQHPRVGVEAHSPSPTPHTRTNQGVTTSASWPSRPCPGGGKPSLPTHRLFWETCLSSTRAPVHTPPLGPRPPSRSDPRSASRASRVFLFERCSASLMAEVLACCAAEGRAPTGPPRDAPLAEGRHGAAGGPPVTTSWPPTGHRWARQDRKRSFRVATRPERTKSSPAVATIWPRSGHAVARRPALRAPRRDRIGLVRRGSRAEVGGSVERMVRSCWFPGEPSPVLAPVRRP